ncbi:MAG: DinB family protein [Chloroflexota bacterium]|nr:DinB family protein [Chloroflexota bacterium]
MTQPSFDLYRPDREPSREQLIDELAAIPARRRELVEAIDMEAFKRPLVADEWAPIEICRHIRDAVQVYGMRFKWMILEDDSFLPNYDEDRWVAGSPDGPAELPAILQQVAAYRSETIRLLRSLSSAGWSRRGRHEISGWVELEPYVGHELAHEEQHLLQLRRAAGDPDGECVASV